MARSSEEGGAAGAVTGASDGRRRPRLYSEPAGSRQQGLLGAVRGITRSVTTPGGPFDLLSAMRLPGIPQERHLLSVVPDESATEASKDSGSRRHLQAVPEKLDLPAARPDGSPSKPRSGASVGLSQPSGIKASSVAATDEGTLRAFLPGSAPPEPAPSEPDVYETDQSGQSLRVRWGCHSPDGLLVPGPPPRSPHYPEETTSSSAFRAAVCSMVQAHDAELQRLQEENSELRRQLEDASDRREGRAHSPRCAAAVHSHRHGNPLTTSSTTSADARRGPAVLPISGVLLRERLQIARAADAFHDHGHRAVTTTVPGSPSLGHAEICRQGSPVWSEPSAVGVTAGEFRVKGPWNRPPRKQASGGSRSLRRLPSQNTIAPPPAFQNFTLHPDSGKRLTWDIICSLLLLYDVVAVPLVYGFSLTNTGFVTYAAIGGLCGWLVDIFMSMITGYHLGRNVVMVPKKIMRRYLRSWALFDVCMVSIDAALLFADAGSINGYFRAFRASRFMRTMRFCRLLKFRGIIQHLQDKFTTESSSICFGVTMIMMVLILANHVVACLWYAVGEWGNPDTSWVIVHDMESKSFLYRYSTSLHWSFTQFTPASMEVTPTNAMERCFAVIALLFAMIIFSSFISILTASIAQLRNLRNVEAKQFWMLKRYLKDWSVPTELSAKIIHHCEFAYEASRRRVQEADVALLSLLSTQMECELKYEMFSVHLRVHGFWHLCGDDARFFAKALTSRLVGRCERVFGWGDHGREVVFCSDGRLRYKRGPTTGEGATSDCLLMDEAEAEAEEEVQVLPVPFQAGDWAAEPVLWTQWTHVGDLTSRSACELITVDSMKFGGCFSNLSSARGTAVAYAVAFVQRLNEVDEENLSDLTARIFDPRVLLEDSKLGVSNVHQSSETLFGEGGVRAAVSKFCHRLAPHCGAARQ